MLIVTPRGPAMGLFVSLNTVLLMICCIAYLTHGYQPQQAPDTTNEHDFEELGLHYGKYLKDVVAALDKDQKFTETIKNMDTADIKSGKVAEQLKHVHEDVRKKLSDLKYLEIKRLRDLAARKSELEQFGETYHGNDKRKWRTLGASLSQLPEHLGSHNSFFDVNDLHKLMVAATNDLEKLDKERQEDFKTYELEKEWQFQERLKMMNETEKEAAIKQRKELKEKHDNHVKVHEPGTKQQFEEVWTKKDNLPVSEFDPKTFFTMHDTNGDKYWDQQEVRQLLSIEIQKIYDPNNSEDDPNEMNEEYEKMREHVYKEIDTDRDGMISYDEFMIYSKKPEFQRDQGWEDLSKKEQFSKQDYEDYTRNRDKMINSMHGHYDPSFYANQPSNMHLPNWGLGMPAGVHPAQYYGYQVDPNHPQAAHIIAAQQQQHMAYQQQAAYHQQAAAQQAAYQQPQLGQPQLQHAAPQMANQQQYQGAVPQIQNQQQFQQHPAQQIAYQQQQQQQQQAIPQQGLMNQQQTVAQPGQIVNQQQAIPQQGQVIGQQQQAPPPPQQQQQPVQTNFQQQIPQQQQQQQQQPQAIPQQQHPQAPNG